MPHVCLVPFTGFRVREQEMLALGMQLPGLQQRAAAIAELPALGLLTLAGMTPPPWTCSYHPATCDSAELVDDVLTRDPALVAVSALTASVEEAYAFSAQIRARGVPVVIGGLHATACPDEAAGHCDAVVVGEGEPLWAQILHDVRAGRLQREYRAAGNFDLADAPVPRFDLLGDRPPRLTLQTQRGCPLACDFCAASRLLGAFREKPAANVRRELAALTRAAADPLLELADDNTFAGTRDAAELLDVLKSSGARYFTECDWRIGERPELLGPLARSGCVQVLVGIESLVFRYPGMGAKRDQLPRMMDAVQAIQEAGIAVNGCFIVGADGETRASLERLVEFVLNSPLADVQMTLQTPFPGTALHRRLARQGRLLPARGWSYYTLFDVAHRPDRLTVEELEQGFRDVVTQVFCPAAAGRRSAIRRRVWKRNPRLRP